MYHLPQTHILGKEYMSLLKVPKKLYYQWISGIDMETATVTGIIDDAIDNAEKVKLRLQKEKMSSTRINISMSTPHSIIFFLVILKITFQCSTYITNIKMILMINKKTYL